MAAKKSKLRDLAPSAALEGKAQGRGPRRWGRELEAADPAAEELKTADLGAKRSAGREVAELRPSKVAPGGLEDPLETGRWRLGGGEGRKMGKVEGG